MKSKIAAIATALILMATPAMADTGGIDRTIMRGADIVESLAAAPAAAFDGIETVVYRHHLRRRFPVVNRALRGGFALPRRALRSTFGEAAGLRGLVTRIAIEEGVPPALGHGVVRIESGYRCNAYNRSGASGIMQILPRTAAGVGIRGNLRSCATGLRAGMRYLRQAYVRAHGNMCVAASFYNTGLGGGGRCSAYGRRVIARGIA
jgi:soluble lytic murein transglycosylase-like protein